MSAMAQTFLSKRRPLVPPSPVALQNSAHMHAHTTAHTFDSGRAARSNEENGSRITPRVRADACLGPEGGRERDKGLHCRLGPPAGPALSVSASCPPCIGECELPPLYVSRVSGRA